MSLSSIQLLRFLLQFILLLGLARAMGEVLRRLGQPQVIGELLGGVLLGPSLLGALWPRGMTALFPTSGVQPVLLQLVAQLGVVLLLLVSGLEVDFELVRAKARPAVLIAIAGMILPFAAGYGLAKVLPPILAGKAGPDTVFALFVATAMSISAIPVIVKILLDMNLMRRDIGQLTVAAGVLSDSAGWLLLAAVSGMATAHGLPLRTLGMTVLELSAFVAFSFTIGYRLMRWFVTWVDDHVGGEGAALSAVIVCGLAGAAVTQAMHLEAFLGTFVIGVQLARVPRIGAELRGKLQALTLAVLAPVFFASAGLQVNLSVLVHPELLLLTLVIITVACATKFAGTYAGARLAGLGRWMSVGLGAGMNVRGAVQIIIATAGLQLAILSVPMYSVIIVMAVATSVLAPPALRWSLRHAPVDRQEEERLRREAWQARSFLHSLRRMLVPVRDGRYALLAARVVSHLSADRTVEAVALHVGSGNPLDPTSHEGETRPGNVIWTQRQISQTSDVAATILAEAERGFDLLVLGARPMRGDVGLFGPLTDTIVRRAPCSVFVLSARAGQATGVGMRRVLLPTTGTAQDRRGTEFALALARGTGAEVVALHVVEHRAVLASLGIGSDEVLRTSEEAGWLATGEVLRLGKSMGVEVSPVVRSGYGLAADQAITAYATSEGCDLIVMAAEARPSGAELYCGRTVSHVVRAATCPVAVLFDPAPPAWSGK